MDQQQTEDVNALIQRRLEEIDELRKRNIEPFAYSFGGIVTSKKIKEEFTEDEQRTVTAAGRIMAIRKMGKASFVHLQDEAGKIQIYLKRDDLGEMYENFKLLDIGDIVGVKGFVFKTRTG